MIEQLQTIARTMLGADHLNDLSAEELRQLIDEYPAFGTGHLLLSRKLKDTGDPDFTPETERTALYFSNPLWLQWLLNEPVAQPDVQQEPAAVDTPDSWAQNAAYEAASPETTILEQQAPVWEPEPEPTPGPEPAFDDFDLSEPMSGSPLTAGDHRLVDRAAPALPEIHERIPDEEASLPEPATLIIPDTESDEAPVAAEPFTETILADQLTVSDNRYEEAREEPAKEPEPVEQFAVWDNRAEAPSEENPAPDQSPDADKTSRPYFFWEKEFQETHSTPVPEQPVEEPAPVIIEWPEAPPVPEEAPVENIQEVRAEEFVLSPEPIQHTRAEEPLDPPAIIQGEKPLDPPEFDEDQELTFQPYHTVDYFASQGIQYEQEDNPTDKFGKQLKSFTAWLKTMKRHSHTVLEAEINEATEAAIQDIAAHSIEEKEVLTEAMAEVLALQGKREKAIDLYTKLSLLNPSKSAYFAARIEQLKVT